MNRNKIFTGLYGYFEVGVDLSSGLFMIIGTNLFLNQYIPGFDSVISSEPAAFLARSFGMMVIISGFLQYAIINFGNQKTRKFGLIGLVIGDLLQIAISGIYFSSYGEWDFLNTFNMIFTPLLVISRIYFLISGIPKNLSSK